MQANFTIVEIKGFENDFVNMDMDGDGIVSIPELVHLSQHLGCKLEKQTLGNMLRHYNTRSIVGNSAKVLGAGDFNYTSFCTMLAEMKTTKASKSWGSLYEKIHGALTKLEEREEKEEGGVGEGIRLSRPLLSDVAGRPPKFGHERFCLCGCHAQEQKPSNKLNKTTKRIVPS